LLFVVSGCSSGRAGTSGAARQGRPGVQAYSGLGTWVSIYEYVPALQPGGGRPPVVPATIDRMAAAGVKTLFLQAANDALGSTADTVDPELLRGFIRRAHQRGLRVVGWYVPHFAHLAMDLRRIVAVAHFNDRGERFDGVALDIEYTNDLPGVRARNAALVRLSQQVRHAVGNRALGAIVLPPVLLEKINAAYWPAFPWRDLAGLYDVWLPMSYWTLRPPASPYRDAFRYTAENTRRLRADLGEPTAAVHVIGGLTDHSSTGDYDGFRRAATEQHAIGVSLYTFRATGPPAWARLRSVS
jgi:uncharacterized lipoprotein YddW (UPF0748 family)